MAVAQGPSLAAVLLLVSSGLHCSSLRPPCPESCSCQKAPLLNCSSSGLSLVPQLIQDSVTELDLSHNLLDTVTLDRPHINLRSVLLGNNSITHLSLCIERDLGSHYVRGRPLYRFRLFRRRECVSWAPTLKLLSVERNQLEQLPQGLEGSESLQVLQLSFNRISTLRPGELSHLRQLKELHLRHNLITSLHPQMFQDLAQLQVLDLSFNILTSLHPLIYLSLRNIGADVRLDGNRWQCDCSMRSLRRWLAYDSSRGLESWSMVCASPSSFSGRDMLQLEEDDLNCFGTERGPELHQDVTVYSGSEILLSCSTQDSVWWMPSGQASLSQPQAGLRISDITERDTGLYVCVSKEHNILSVFSLHISKIGGARRKTRSLPRARRQIVPQSTPNRIGQERNQRASQPDLILAVCLSVFITFLVAFILGVLARPCIDVLWRRVTKKKRSSVTNAVSSVEQRHYQNEAYDNDEDPEHVETHRERRVTFSNVEDINVQYYDTIPNLESNNNDAVIECEAAEAEKDTECSGSENSSRRSSLETNQRDGREGIEVGRTHKIEFEHIPDPVELDRGRSSSCSDSSLSDKIFNQDKMTRGDDLTPKSRQLAEDSVQQRADAPTAGKVEGLRESPGFSSEPFADWSPHSNNTNLTYYDLGQENEEQFEFSDSIRSTSTRSGSVCGSFNDSKLIVEPSTDKQKTDDMSSSISYVSEDEVTQYIVNSDQEEEVIERKQNKPEVTSCLKQDASFEQQIRPSVQGNQGNYKYDKHKPTVRHDDSFSSHSSDSDGENYTVKKGSVTSHGTSLDTQAPSLPAAYSSCSSSESEAEITDLKGKLNKDRVIKSIKITKPQTLSTDLDGLCIPQMNKRVSINATLPVSYSSSNDETMDVTTKHSNKQEQREVDMAGLPVKENQSVRHDAIKPQLPTPIKRRAPLPPTNSSSSGERTKETMDHMQKQGETHMTMLPIGVSQNIRLDHPQPPWPALDLEHTTRIKWRLDIKAPSPASASSSSIDREDETTHQTKRPGKVEITGLPLQESQTGSHDPDTRWPALNLEHIPRINRRLYIKAPPPDLSSRSGSEDETTIHIKNQAQGQMNMARLPSKVSQTVSYDPQPQWPALELEHTTRIKRRLDIKAPSPASDSSSSIDSEDETTHQTKRPGKVEITGLPLQESQTGSHDPDTRWPALNLEHIPRINRRLYIKAPPPDLSSRSGSEDETTIHIKNQAQGQMNMARLSSKVSQTVSYDPQPQWPALELEHTTRIKRRLDIKAPSPASDSSSSSDSDDETTHHTERPGRVDIAGPPSKVSQTVSYDPQTQLPALDLDHTMRIKRRLDIKAPSPASDSSSSSDSEDETTHHTTKERPGVVGSAGHLFQESQVVNQDPETQWPALDLGNITRIKRRLDIKAPSPASGSSSSSGSEDETIHHTERPVRVEITGLPLQESQTESHDPDTRWPALDLQHIPQIKRHLDIKAPPPDLSSSSGSEDETTIHIKNQEQGQRNTARLPSKVSQTVTYKNPQPQWPALDLEPTMRIKRRLDIKAPSPASDSFSSHDSDDETIHHTERPVRVDIAGPPSKVSQTVSAGPDTRWPALDLKHTTRIKRRLDIKAPSPASDSSSSGDSEDETTHHTEKPGRVDIAGPPSKVSQTVSYDPQTQLPALDLDHTMRIKRRLDIKAPAPASDSSSSSDSEDETHHTTKERPGVVGSGGHQFQESQVVNQDPETQWPALDLGNITRIKRRLDIKARSPASGSSSSSGSEEAIKEEGMENLRYPPTTVKPDSRWPRLDLSSALYGKRHLNIKIRSPPPESSSSSNESEDGTTNLPVKVETDRTDVGITSYQPGRKLLDMSVTVPSVKRRLDIKGSSQPTDSCSSSASSIGDNESRITNNEQQAKLHKFPYINRRLEFKAPSPQSDPILSSVSPGFRKSESNSSRSNSEDEYRNQPKLGLGVSSISKATEKEFIRLPKTHISRSPKTDHSITLEKYTVVKEEVGGETKSDISKTPEITPELQSRWATMNLGVSRFRKRLEITSHTHKPPHLPSSTPPDSPSSSSSESGTGSKSSRIRRKRRGVGMEEIIHTESSQSLSNIPPIYMDIRAPLQRKSSSSNSEDETIEHSGPDLSLGVPRVKRRLDVKAPLPEQSDSPSSCSESENKVTRYTTNQSRHASNMSGMTDDDSLITYKRIIMKASSPLNNSIYPSDHTKQRHMGGEILTVAKEGPFHSVGDRNASKRVRSLNFDKVVKKRIEQPRNAMGVDLPPEIRWIGVGRQLSDLSFPSPRRDLDMGLSSPQHASSAEPELPQPDSSSIESDHTKQDRDVTLMDKQSSPSSNSVSLAPSRNEERMERKGLSALKAMSSLRSKWEPLDENLDKGASSVFDYYDAQSVTSFNYLRSEDIKPLAKQPLTQSHRSSTSVDERRAIDLLYDIPRYRRHDIEGIEPPQRAPPPIPATPPPYEAVGLTWRSPQSSRTQVLEGTRSYLQQSRNTEEYDPSSLAPQNQEAYFDSSNVNISEV